MSQTPPVDPTDLWSLAQSNEYDVDKIYTRSTDNKGHAVNIQCPIQPAIHGEIAAIIQSGVIREYRTIQDFIRDAVLHRAKHVADRIKDGTFSHAIDIEIMKCEVERQTNRRNALRGVIAQATEELAELHKEQDYENMQNMVVIIQGYIDSTPQPYKEELDSLVKRYRHIAWKKEDG